MKTTQTTTITKTMPKMAPKPQRQKRRRNAGSNQVMTKIVNTSANVANGSTIRNGPGAKMRSNGNITRVTHREFISDITSNAAGFATTNIAINPGNATAFPWLSAIAANYESYTFKKLAYRYVPLCPTSTQGRITMAIDYDARDSIPSSKAVLSSYQGSVATPVWQQGLCVATSSNLVKFTKQRYVSGPTVPANSDIKTYHLGYFILGTSNTPAASTQLGELWVEYDVEFQTPQIASLPSVASQDARQPLSGGAQRVKIGIRAGQPVFDTSFTDELHNILGGSWDYIQNGIGMRKFSIMLNKNINHPVLYLIKYAANVATGLGTGELRFVRPFGTNTGFFMPSFRNKGRTTPASPLDFSSIDLSATGVGIGISDGVNSNLGGSKRFLSFIAYPASLNPGGLNDNTPSQLQFAYPQNASNVDSMIDIQTFALPSMQISDDTNAVMASTPAEGSTSQVNTYQDVETAGWLQLTNQLSSFGATTFRQTRGPHGEVKFTPIVEHRDDDNSEQSDVDTSLYTIIESVIKRLQEKAVIDVSE